MHLTMTHLWELTSVNLHVHTVGDMILVWFTLSFIILIVIPTSIYSAISYWKHRSLTCIRARHPRTILLLTFGAILYILSKSFKFILASDLYYNTPLYVLYFFLSPISSQIVIYSSFLRFWLLFYDVKHSKAMENNCWKKYIDPSSTTTSFWLLNNKKTFGNEWWCGKILILLMIISLFVTFSVAIFCEVSGEYINVILHSFPLLLIAIIWWKTPKCYDLFRIREEARTFLTIAVILLLIHTILTSITIFGDMHIFSVQVMREWSFIIGIWLMLIHSTWWALKKSFFYETEETNLYTICKRIYKSKAIAHKQNINLENHNININNNVISASYCNLIKILSNIYSFKLFMAHLNKEFCIENGLAIIEFTQYQQLMYKIYVCGREKSLTLKVTEYINNTVTKLRGKHEKISKSDGDEGGEEDIEIVYNDETDEVENEFEVFLDLPHSLPKSSIIWDDEKEELNVKIIKLMQKYIHFGSDFELNLSSKLRKKMINQAANIDNLQENEKLYIFDFTIKTLLHLLSDSLSRFTESDAYKHIEKTVSNQTLNINKITRSLSY